VEGSSVNGGGPSVRRRSNSATHALSARLGPVADGERQGDTDDARDMTVRPVAKQELDGAPGSVEQGLLVVIGDALAPILADFGAALEDIFGLDRGAAERESVKGLIGQEAALGAPRPGVGATWRRRSEPWLGPAEPC
jgi:hypothetical protein